MKKIICLLSVVVLAITSCSSDDEPSNPVLPTPLLVKQFTSIRNGKEYVEKITYDGNKIVNRIGSDNYTTKYTYTENLITKIEYIDGNGVLEQTNQYTYVGGKLSSLLEIVPGSTYNDETKYGYYNEGSVPYTQKGYADYEKRSTNIKTGEVKFILGGRNTFANGNLVKKTWSLYGVGNGTIDYEYDTKFNPWRNVIGLNALVDEEYSINNITKVTSTDRLGKTSISTYAYIYNSTFFPIEAAYTLSDGTLTSAETIKIGY